MRISGRLARCRYAITPTVSVASTKPAIVRWAKAIAGIVCDRSKGAYSGVPSAVWKRVGCRPNSTAATRAPTFRPT